MKQFIIIIASFLLVNTYSFAQEQIIQNTTIIDSRTSEPLQGAVAVIDNKVVAISDFSGTITLETKNEKPVTIRYAGYESQTVSKIPALIRLAESSTEINQVIVSASRQAQQRSEAPIAISTINTATLAETKANQLDEVLNKVSGVNMVSLGNEQHTMAIRQPINFKGLFLYLEDGLPIRPTGVFNHNALLEMNMAALSKIEVVKGPSSSIYGSEAIGGAVNFITLKPSAIPTAKLSLRGNDIGYKRIDGNASSMFGKLGVAVSGYYAKNSDGFRPHSDLDKTALSAKATYSINQKNDFSFDVTYVDFYTDMTGSVNKEFYEKRNYASQHTFTNRDVNLLRSKLVYNHTWNENSKTMIAPFFRVNSIRQNPSYRVADDKNRNNPTGDPNLAYGELNENKVNSIGAIAQYIQNFDVLNGLRLTGGILFDNSPNSFYADQIKITKSDAGIYTDFAKTGKRTKDYEVKLNNSAVYTNADLRLRENLQVTAALRYDRLDFDYKNLIDAGQFAGTSDDVDAFTAVTPKLGLTYNVANNTGVYANFSQGFLPPQLSELYRGKDIPKLKPAEYNNYEIGGWAQAIEQLSVDASLYLMKGANEIISVKNADGSFTNANAGKTNHYGIEYGIHYMPVEQLHFRLSGTNAKHEFEDYVEKGKDYSSKEMSQAPSFIGNSELTYRPKAIKGLRVSAEVQRISKYFMDNNNTKEYNGHNLVNMRIGYDAKHFDVWLNGMNLFDTLYSTSARTAWGRDSYTVGNPRAINIGATYKFSKQ